MGKRKADEGGDEEDEEDDELEDVSNADVLQDPKWLLRVPLELREQVEMISSCNPPAPN